MIAEGKMSFGKKIAWILTIIFLAYILIAGLYDGSILTLFVFVIMVCLVANYGPAGLLLLFTVMTLIVAIGLPLSWMDSTLPGETYEWFIWFGCIAVGSICIFSLCKWNLLPMKNKLIQTRRTIRPGRSSARSHPGRRGSGSVLRGGRG
jgi:energy-coupling factor transporter transmembrane protein EcfT